MSGTRDLDSDSGLCRYEDRPYYAKRDPSGEWRWYDLAGREFPAAAELLHPDFYDLDSASHDPGHIAGLTLSKSADNDIDIAPGSARDDDDAQNMDLAATLTKQIDAAWAVGDDAGGLDTGTVTNSTWYHVHLIRRSDTGVVDGLFSLSPTSPTLPAGYDAQRRLGSVYYATGAFQDFHQPPEQPDLFLWLDKILDVSSGSATTTPALVVLSVPTGVAVTALVLAVSQSAAGSTVLVDSPAKNAETPYSLNADLVYASYPDSARRNILTDSSARVRVVGETTITYSMWTAGWLDRRGRD